MSGVDSWPVAPLARPLPMLADLIDALLAILRVVVAVGFVLLPGYVIVRAAFASGSLESSRFVTTTIACGTCAVGIGGLVLNALPGGLSPQAWFVAWLSTLLFCFGVAVARGHIRPQGWIFRRPAEATGARRWQAVLRRPFPAGAEGARRSGLTTAISLLPGLALLLAVGLGLGTLSLARAGAAEEDRRQAFTELWTQMNPAGSGSVRIGITSHEPSATDYRLVVESGGRIVDTYDGIRLDPVGTWETSIVLPVVSSAAAGPDSTGAGGASRGPGLVSTMTATLFQDGSTAPYRMVTIHGSAP